MLPKSPMGQAVRYALGNWEALVRHTTTYSVFNVEQTSGLELTQSFGCLASRPCASSLLSFSTAYSWLYQAKAACERRASLVRAS